MKTETLIPLSKRFKLVAWLNIAIQTSFPIVSVFTPIISSSQDNSHFLTKQDVLIDRQTQVYTLIEGENTLSVAKKYNMSVDALRKLNQFRTFAHGFDKLQAGDELDVPMAALPTIEWHAETKPEKPQNNQEQDIANFASQAGQFLSNNPNKDTASALARGMASATASSYLQQWFSHVGNSRIQLDVDESFALKNSQVDLLVPLYDQKDKLLFTQGSLHHTDGRAQTNLGLGVRWFQPDYMLGANSFLDYDLSRSHSRMGLGVEYRRDYLKLAANSYHRLSGWKDSKDLDDYQERAANGWDIRSEAWLPSYPHVGAKLSYEQYYGNEVGLFGSDKRRADPQALTVGLSYTPFPLLTINAERRRGTSDERDSKIGLQLNYQLGTAWQQQINPDNVSALRTLQGSRYDFVDRNNNIVLEYRKKEVINLSVSSPITGYAGEEKPLTFTVNSKYGLDRIEWSAPQLIAANGQLIDNKKGEYRVKLPDYQANKQATNSYVINAVAIDKQGNRSANVAVQVTVTQAAIFAGNSQVSPTKFTLAANGTAQKKITITIKDKNNQLVDVAANEISLKTIPSSSKRIRATIKKAPSVPEHSPVTISEFTRIAPGIYSVTITAGETPEQVTLTPVVRNILLTSIDVILTADSQTAHLTKVTVNKNDAPANGKDENYVALVIQDAKNHPLIAHTVKFTVTNKANVASQRETDENGEIVIPITSTTSGKAVLTINYGGTTTKTAEINFNADPKTAKIADKDGFTITPEKSVANGKTAKDITITVTDAHNNLVEKAPVTLKTSNGQFANGQPIDNTLVTDDKGKVTAKLTSKVAGIAEITATVNRKSHTQKTTFTSDATSAQIKPLTVSSTTEIANGKQPINVTAMVIDNNNNPLIHQKIKWSADKTSGVTFDAETFTDDKGQITLPITSTVAGDINITASTENAADQSIKITFLADPKTAKINTSEFTVGSGTAIANGSDAIAISAIVTDKYNNPVPKYTVKFESDNGTLKHSTVETDDRGEAKSSITNTTAGKTLITAMIGIKPFAKSVTFTGDSSTIKFDSLKASTSVPPLADGDKAFDITAILVDDHGNPLKDTVIHWKSDQTSTTILSDKETQTDLNGKTHITVKSTLAGDNNITATVHGKHVEQSIKINFIADRNTATIATSDLNIDEANTIADGTKAKTITATVTDANGNILSDIDVKFTTTEGSFTVGKMMKTMTKKTAKDGTAKVKLTSTKADTVTITATVNGHVVHQSSQFVADTTHAKITTIAGENKSAVADGKDTIRFEAQVTDNLGNPIEGATINWKSNFSSRDVQFTNPSIPTNKEGKTFIKVTSYKAADVIITGTIAGNDTTAEKVTFTADLKTAKLAAFNTLPETIVANGKDIVTLETQVVDANDNPIEGISVHFQADNGAIITPSVISKKDGSVESRLTTDNIANKITITANIDKKSSIKSTIKSIADIKTATIALQTSSKSAPASNLGVTSGIQLIATVTDAKGHPLAGIPVIWSKNFNRLDNDTTETDDKGKTSVILYGTKAGKTAVTASLLNKKLAKEEVAFTAGAINDTNSSLKMSQDSILADGVNISMARLTLKDMWGNPVTGQTIKWSRSSTEVTINDKGEIDSSGIYQAEVTSKKAGIHNISANINGIIKKEKIGVIADTSTAIIDSIKIEGANTTHADGNSKITLVATIKDTGTNPVEHVTIGWNTTVGTLSAPTSNTDYHGKAYITVTSTEAKKGKITAQIASSTKISSEVEFTAGIVSSTQSTATLSSAVINAGSGETTLTVKAKDEQGNPLAKLSSKIQLTDSANLITLKPAFNETQPGTYEAQLRATTAKTTQLIIKIDGHKINEKPTLTIQPDSSSARVKDKINIKSLNATVGEKVIYSVVLEDKYANPLKAGEVVFWSANEGTHLSENQTLTDINGERSITVTRQTVGDAKVKLNLGSNTSYSKDAPVVKFTQSNVDTRHSTIKLAQSTINAGQKTVLTIILKDQYGNLLDNLAADIKAHSNHANISIKPAVKKSIGVYELEVTSNKIATAEISVEVSGKTLADRENITVQGDPSSWKISKVESDTLTLKAGNKKGVTYSATVVDKFNNVLPKIIVSWHVDGKAEKYEYATSTDDTGIAKVTVTSNTMGELMMTATLAKGNEFKANKVTVTQGDVNLTDSKLTSNKTEIGADNLETMTLTVKVTDDFGNPIIGRKIEISSDKPHFIINPSITDNKDGSYQTTALSNKQGTYTLTAKVDGKPLTKTLTVKSGAANPVLSFRNQDKSTVYSSKPYDEQVNVEGLPKGAIPIWESSNTSVASVDKDGKVNLHKAGIVKITARIQGNGVYNSAQASYTLNIDRADPQLDLSHLGILQAEWDDGKNIDIVPNFINADTKHAQPPVTYSIDNVHVATIDTKTGKITQVKPGKAEITIYSDKTEQFNADSKKVTYSLDKRRFDVSFDKPTLEITNNKADFNFQPTKIRLPKNIVYSWTSGSDKVITIKNNKVISLDKGESKLTMTVKPNDYFVESSGDYNVEVYSNPSITISSIEHASNGGSLKAGNSWAPVYTDDNLRINWSISNSKYDKATSASIILFYSDGSTKEVAHYNESEIHNSMVTTVVPTKSYLKKEFSVGIKANGKIIQGTSLTNTQKSSDSIKVIVTSPKDIGHITNTSDYFIYERSDGSSATSCRRMHGVGSSDGYVVIKPKTSFDIGSKTLIAPLYISHDIIGTIKGTTANFVNYNNQVPTITSMVHEVKSNDKKYAVKDYCWRTHEGVAQIGVSLNFEGQLYTIKEESYWYGYK
ncbi:Ig-like domain-containing protein [Providencia rettgeri]|nr:Ig-like domain-containing protein [Providencia rettgeri]